MKFIYKILSGLVIGSIVWTFLELLRIYDLLSFSEMFNALAAWFFVLLYLYFALFKKNKYRFVREIYKIPYSYAKIRDDYKQYYSSKEELLFLSGITCLGAFINDKTALIDSIYQAAIKYEGTENEIDMLIGFESKILGLELRYLNFFVDQELGKNPKHIIDTFGRMLEEIKKKTNIAFLLMQDEALKQEAVLNLKEKTVLEARKMYESHQLFINNT